MRLCRLDIGDKVQAGMITLNRHCTKLPWNIQKKNNKLKIVYMNTL